MFLEAYRSFAYVYDLLMDDIPYDEWVSYILSLWAEYDSNPKLVLELGCGTGNITLRLAELGYDMIGSDISEDMLTVAKSKQKNNDVLFLCQDMRSFELYGTVDSIICLFDSLNYILNENELLDTFKLVYNYLNPDGIFIFDLNTAYKFKHVLDNNSFSVVKDSAACIWGHIYNDDILEYFVTLFIKQNADSYQKSEEFHYQKSYPIKKIKHLLDLAGLKLLNTYDAFTFDPVKPNSERVYFIASK
ncbi:MAG: class I SAM-dependent methyltransferase [Clostridiales bacterium]|nr:class I SAM-dependent methyltransferase [Clostridiales bacterium]